MDQIRRAVVSGFSNIAEGCKRDSDKELVHFFYISMGSLGEVEVQLLFAERVGYLNKEDTDRLICEVREIS